MLGWASLPPAVAMESDAAPHQQQQQQQQPAAAVPAPGGQGIAASQLAVALGGLLAAGGGHQQQQHRQQVELGPSLGDVLKPDLVVSLLQQSPEVRRARQQGVCVRGASCGRLHGRPRRCARAHTHSRALHYIALQLVAQLAPHLPEEQRSVQSMADVIASAQFRCARVWVARASARCLPTRAAPASTPRRRVCFTHTRPPLSPPPCCRHQLDVMSQALATGQLSTAQFGLPPGGFGVMGLLAAIQQQQQQGHGAAAGDTGKGAAGEQQQQEQ